jgi:hypothetical protein
MQLFLKVWGVGEVKARHLVAQGFRTIEDLRSHPHVLTSVQQLGLRYMEDYNQRIPRAEVAEFHELVLESRFE